MVVVFVLLVWGSYLFLLICTQLGVAPNISDFPEVDVASKCSFPAGTKEDGILVCDYASALQEAGLENASSKEIVQGVKEKFISLDEMQASGRKTHVLTVRREDSN
jgi:hypothetical protein